MRKPVVRSSSFVLNTVSRGDLMENDMFYMLKKCGGYVASQRGVYFYDEDDRSIKYIDKAYIDTPEEDAAWTVVYRESDSQKSVKPKKENFKKSEAIYCSWDEEKMLDNLLFSLKKAGGSFDTMKYHYQLDLKTKLILRMDVNRYYSGVATRDDWTILGAFEIL